MHLFNHLRDPSLQHLRESIEKANHHAPSLLPLIENHHDYLKHSIRTLTDSKSAAGEKAAALSQFIPVLRMHLKAEEETLYRRLLRDELPAARIEGMGGKDEHDIASLLADELEELGFLGNWTESMDAKAKVLANLVRHHLEEEEEEMFGVVKEHIDDDELHSLGEFYVEKCRNYLEQELNPTFARERRPPWANPARTPRGPISKIDF
jgi:hemerythrin-like domain-containing protein